MEHRNAVCTLSIRASTLKRIDQEIVLQHNKEVEYWRNVLKRVIEAIKFISIRGLPFFGDDEKLNSDHNGNFLGILELISKFDPFLENHLSQFGNKGSGNVNYISSFTVRQIVDQMASKVLNHIVTEIKKVKYFGLIVDSTPDIAHVDQLSYILRYVTEEGEVLERFIKFQNIYSHTAESLTTHIVSLLKELNISINNCIGQSYDNASNMSGKYSGLQARIKQLSPKAEYVPCAAHSINLVGISTVESCLEAVNYCGVVQSLYVFFSSSPRRWDLLKEQLKCNKTPLTLKSTSNTRWSVSRVEKVISR
uniref:Zinc finger MYM-type protein 1 n=1 Tax=Sipha flava TaxID=143950 RepID=A0A2S2Q4N5_9HEMI